MSDSFASLLLVQCAGMVLLTGYTAIAAAVNAEVFPARVRAAGIGFPYHADLFPWYVSALCLVSFLVYLTLPETSRQKLEK